MESYFSEKKIPFKISLLIDKGPDHPGVLMEVYKIRIIFMPAWHNIHSAAHSLKILKKVSKGTNFLIVMEDKNIFFHFVLVIKENDNPTGDWIWP